MLMLPCEPYVEQENTLCGFIFMIWTFDIFTKWEAHFVITRLSKSTPRAEDTHPGTDGLR